MAKFCICGGYVTLMMQVNWWTMVKYDNVVFVLIISFYVVVVGGTWSNVWCNKKTNQSAIWVLSQDWLAVYVDDQLKRHSYVHLCIIMYKNKIDVKHIYMGEKKIEAGSNNYWGERRWEEIIDLGYWSISRF